MRKHSLLSRNSGTYTSPGTPEYRDLSSGGFQKGWSSERVPLPANSSRRHISAAALMPFNSGRTLPSKWDDAERWITSPVSGFGASQAPIAQAERRPKSKSGPLGAHGVACFSNYSPAMPLLQGGRITDFMVGSPFSTGVLVPEGLSIHYGRHDNVQSNPVHIGNDMSRVSSLPGWSDLLSEASLPSSQDEKLDGTKEGGRMVSPVVSRRDMATQMSPRDSICSSPKRRSSSSTSPPRILPAVESQSSNSAKTEVRDVQVDKRATVTRQSRNTVARQTKSRTPVVDNLTSSWDITEPAKNSSKRQREEAKITAWENLQKAKAEAAIQKLEMKLEKRRSASMDKILNKLRNAQMNAQEKRTSIADVYDQSEPKTSNKVGFFKYLKMSALKDCFICQAS